MLERPAAEAEGRGRPPTLLGLNARAGAAVGVAFGHERLYVAVADPSTTVLAEAKLGLDVATVGWASVRRRRLSDRRAQPAGGDQTYGVVVVTATNPSRSRIGRLSGEAST